jgi:hypothetical protein
MEVEFGPHFGFLLGESCCTIRGSVLKHMRKTALGQSAKNVKMSGLGYLHRVAAPSL